MNESAQATTQYGDLKGEISVDGHQGAFLDELAKRAGVPGRYCPVALGFYFEGGHLIAYLLAVDRREVKEYGSLESYAQGVGEMPVSRYSFDATPEEILQLCKRVSVLLKSKAVRGTPMNIVDGH